MIQHFSNLNQENKELKIYRPFGPSIGHCKLPQELINDFNKDCDNIVGDKEKSKLHDFSDELVGNVKQELSISPEVFEKWAPYFQKIITAFLNSHPEELKELKKIIFKSGWYVRTLNGDFNPLHYHTNCHMSCVGYLSLPDGIQDEWDKEDKDHHPSAGTIEMQFGQVQLFSTNTIRIRPKLGDYYLFPWWMYHMVYPFRTKGERRSFSFNVLGEPKTDDNKPKLIL